MDKENEIQETGNTEIQTTEAQPIAAMSPVAQAAALVAANSNMDIEKMDKLLDMQIKWEANEAKKAYVVAMAGFKANPPEIFKDKAVSYGNTNYSHASLHNVTTCINKSLSEHGLTASWFTDQKENSEVKVTCKIVHVLGHSESTALSAPPDDSGKKNRIQQIASTVTYLQRYTLLALTGLATCDQDDDGKGADKEKPLPAEPLPKQLAMVKKICEQLVDSAPDGWVVSEQRLTAFCVEHGKFPSTPDSEKVAISYFAEPENIKKICIKKESE